MSTPYEVQLVQDMRPLCGPVQDALSHGIEVANTFLRKKKMDRPERDGLRHNIARAAAHDRLLRIQDDLEGWTVGPVRPDSSLVLKGPRHTILRVLHEAQGRIPAPGTNRARRAFYAQGMLSVDAPIPTLESQRLIASWFVPDLKLPDVEVNIYRPISVFKYGSPGKADMSFPLPYDADDLDALEWHSSEDGIELPIPGEGESGAEPADG